MKNSHLQKLNLTSAMQHIPTMQPMPKNVARMTPWERNPEFLHLVEKMGTISIDDVFDFKPKEGAVREGSTGNVRLAYSRGNGRRVAVKTITKESLDTTEMVQFLVNEINALKNLSHPQLLEYIGALRDEKNVYIITEFAEIINCAVLTPRCKHRVPEVMALGIIRDVLQGMTYMHAKGWAHLDLSPRNVMVARTLKVKIIDFRCSVKLQSVKHAVCTQYSGIAKFRAPEVDKRKPFIAEKADIYSVGATLCYMVGGVTQGLERPVWPLQHVTPEVSSFVQLLTHEDPTKRPTALGAIARIEGVMRQLNVRSLAPVLGQVLGYLETPKDPIPKEFDIMKRH